MTVVTTAPGVDFFRLDEQLSPAELDVRDRVRLFAERDLLPIAQDYWDRAEVPLDLLPGLARLGIIGGSIEGYGCPGSARPPTAWHCRRSAAPTAVLPLLSAFRAALP